jgi:hypothetical protein
MVPVLREKPPLFPQKGMVFDLTRPPGIANRLVWYYMHVDKDPRVLSAVGKFDQFLLNPEEAKAFGQLNHGAAFIQGDDDSDTATASPAMPSPTFWFRGFPRNGNLVTTVSALPPNARARWT